jgi:hypothetical protein
MASPSRALQQQSHTLIPLAWRSRALHLLCGASHAQVRVGHVVALLKLRQSQDKLRQSVDKRHKCL